MDKGGQAEQEAGVETILFITLSNIGDAVLTTPTLVLLHQLFPAAAVDIVGDRRSIDLFQHCPFRRRLYEKDKHKPLRGGLELLRRLRPHRYDLIVDLRTDILPLLLRGRCKYAYRHGEKSGHAVLRHASVIGRLTKGRAVPGTQVWLSPAEHHFAARQLARLAGKTLLAIGPGSRGEHKIWPWQGYAELSTRLAGAYDALVLLGGDKDIHRGAAIAAAVDLPLVNLCGKTRLLEAAAVLARCALFIGNDSGLGHLASAVATPTFTVFGRGQPQRYRPWGEKAGWYAAPQADIDQIEARQVMDGLQAHLAGLNKTGA